MWRISKWSVCRQYLKRIMILLAFAKKKFLKYPLMSFCFVLMIETWYCCLKVSGWIEFGVGGADAAEQCGE